MAAVTTASGEYIDMTDYPLLDLIGQFFMVGFEGEAFDASIRDLLLAVRPSGIILFKRNVGGGPDQVARLVRACQDLSRSMFGRPLLVAIDQEGGPVRRLAPPFTQLPSQRAMAADPDPERVRDLGRTSGRELAAVGLNFNLAPVLDLATGPESDLMAERSFGPDPRRAADLGRALIQGHRERGVLTCGKHFPGIGDVRIDPHEDLAVVEHSARRLRSVEAEPFAEAIRDGLPAVMTSHVLFPDLDPDWPATFSSIIQTEYLRRDLGFEGLVLTDDMEMGAMVKHFPMGPAAVKAVQSGADLLLICHRGDRAAEAGRALIEAAREAEISTRRLEDTALRLERVRAGLTETTARAWAEVFPDEA